MELTIRDLDREIIHLILTWVRHRKSFRGILLSNSLFIKSLNDEQLDELKATFIKCRTIKITNGKIITASYLGKLYHGKYNDYIDPVTISIDYVNGLKHGLATIDPDYGVSSLCIHHDVRHGKQTLKGSKTGKILKVYRNGELASSTQWDKNGLVCIEQGGTFTLFSHNNIVSISNDNGINCHSVKNIHSTYYKTNGIMHGPSVVIDGDCNLIQLEYYLHGKLHGNQYYVKDTIEKRLYKLRTYERGIPLTTTYFTLEGFDNEGLPLGNTKADGSFTYKRGDIYKYITIVNGNPVIQTYKYGSYLQSKSYIDGLAEGCCMGYIICLNRSIKVYKIRNYRKGLYHGVHRVYDSYVSEGSYTEKSYNNGDLTGMIYTKHADGVIEREAVHDAPREIYTTCGKYHTRNIEYFGNELKLTWSFDHKESYQFYKTFTGKYSDYIPHGRFVDNAGYLTISNYDHGVKHGESIRYTASGQVWMRKVYEHGRVIGVYRK